jgi:hypothetical protein
VSCISPKIVNLSTHFCLRGCYPIRQAELTWGECGMVDVLDVRADVLNFREEAKGCFLLAQAETDRQVRIILMGMAVGWLKLANHTPSEALQLEHTDRNG